MATSRLTEKSLQHFETVLRENRAELEEHQRQIAESLGEVREAREGERDDEHDPEGPTVAYEWSRVTAIQAEALAHLREIDGALGRLDDGSYGVCTRCGKPIARARLDARPAAELCIDCARLAEASGR